MKLLYTPNSPYSRIARVCALELKVDVSFVKVAVRDLADDLLKYNPAAMVPTLVLSNGVNLSETRIICEYFEGLGQGGFLTDATDLEGRQWEGLLTGFLDGIAVWVREARRPEDEQSPGVIALEERRAIRCLRHIEASWDMESMTLDFAATALVSALELLDTRLPMDWKDESPGLADWYANLSLAPGLRNTAPLPV